MPKGSNTVVIPTTMKDKIKKALKKSGHPTIRAFVEDAINEKLYGLRK